MKENKDHQLVTELIEIESIIELAYEAAEKQFNDEVLLHCGMAGTKLNQAISKIKKHLNEE